MDALDREALAAVQLLVPGADGGRAPEDAAAGRERVVERADGRGELARLGLVLGLGVLERVGEPVLEVHDDRDRERAGPELHHDVHDAVRVEPERVHDLAVVLLEQLKGVTCEVEGAVRGEVSLRLVRTSGAMETHQDSGVNLASRQTL